jgi:hypothetical protein
VLLRGQQKGQVAQQVLVLQELVMSLEALQVSGLSQVRQPRAVASMSRQLPGEVELA